MINGAHVVIYSTDADADRWFFQNVLGLTNVDAGEGWLIFALPPAELAVHPGEKNDVHEIYLTCEDIHAFIALLRSEGLGCSPIREQPWGYLTRVKLPGGGRIGVYEPRHARPAT